MMLTKLYVKLIKGTKKSKKAGQSWEARVLECELLLQRVVNTQYENFMKAPLNVIPNDNIQEIQNYFDKYYGEIK